MIEINKIYNEDCLETMSRMPDGFIDLTVTSPPYDNLRDYKGYSFEFEKIAKELYRVTKEGGVVVWVVNDATVNGSETGTSFKQALFFKEIGFNLHDTMIFDSKKAPLTHNRYEQSFEFMFVFSKNFVKTFNAIRERKIWPDLRATKKVRREKDGSYDIGKHSDSTDRIKYNIWAYATGGGLTTRDEVAYQHPAVFPEKLARDHIFSWSNENDLVYDPFMGSGTTAKMAIRLKRNFIGSEISKEYCEIIHKRIQPELNQIKLAI